jgi:hypothetical protein
MASYVNIPGVELIVDPEGHPNIPNPHFIMKPNPNDTHDRESAPRQTKNGPHYISEENMYHLTPIPIEPAPSPNYGNNEFIELARTIASSPQATTESESFTIPPLPPSSTDDSIKKRHQMLYEIEDIPSWYSTIFLGLQVMTLRDK